MKDNSLEIKIGLESISENCKNQPNTMCTMHQIRSKVEIFLNKFYQPAPPFNVEYCSLNKTYTITL